MYCLSKLIKSCFYNFNLEYENNNYNNNYIEMKQMTLKKHLLSDDIMYR